MEVIGFPGISCDLPNVDTWGICVPMAGHRYTGHPSACVGWVGTQVVPPAGRSPQRPGHTPCLWSDSLSWTCASRRCLTATHWVLIMESTRPGSSRYACTTMSVRGSLRGPMVSYPRTRRAMARSARGGPICFHLLACLAVAVVVGFLRLKGFTPHRFGTLRT